MATDANTGETDDYVAITRLQSSYADAVTRRAWPELVDLFGPDATLTVGRGESARTTVGPVAIGELIDAATSHLHLLVFVVLNTKVEIEGRRARCRSFISEMHLAREGGTRQDLFGVYHDRLERRDGRWWFAERHWHRLARTGRDMDSAEFPSGFGDWLS